MFMCVTLSVQDLMALSSTYTDRPSMDEVINDPTNSRHYWRYRVHVTLETLLEDSGMATLMQVKYLLSNVCHISYCCL